MSSDVRGAEDEAGHGEVMEAGGKLNQVASVRVVVLVDDEQLEPERVQNQSTAAGRAPHALGAPHPGPSR